MNKDMNAVIDCTSLKLLKHATSTDKPSLHGLRFVHVFERLGRLFAVACDGVMLLIYAPQSAAPKGLEVAIPQEIIDQLPSAGTMQITTEARGKWSAAVTAMPDDPDLRKSLRWQAEQFDPWDIRGTLQQRILKDFQAWCQQSQGESAQTLRQPHIAMDVLGRIVCAAAELRGPREPDAYVLIHPMQLREGRGASRLQFAGQPDIWGLAMEYSTSSVQLPRLAKLMHTEGSASTRSNLAALGDEDTTVFVQAGQINAVAAVAPASHRSSRFSKVHLINSSGTAVIACGDDQRGALIVTSHRSQQSFDIVLPKDALRALKPKDHATDVRIDYRTNGRCRMSIKHPHAGWIEVVTWIDKPGPLGVDVQAILSRLTAGMADQPSQLRLCDVMAFVLAAKKFQKYHAEYAPLIQGHGPGNYALVRLSTVAEFFGYAKAIETVERAGLRSAQDLLSRIGAEDAENEEQAAA